MSKKNVKREKLYLIVIVLFLIGYPTWKYFLKTQKKDYTVGEITGYFTPVRLGTSAVFLYSVNGIEYEGTLSLKSFELKPEVGMMYIVEYAERNDGKYGEIRPDLRLREKVNEIPKSGWDELPANLKFYSN
ncbi:hypothetical protein [Roseivirga misakiensis]|uniref:Uncharacterized protein n=1 Tax=Roseivirga misakiensis TaxID=1563681 RepID=A0A1E5T343_9BACT|nr:hypothetical protein [Roseivirga misakiensis]OEK05792.1 hypothetical protein BFP71_06645 [Roseivirga misakiensis]